jgi:archaellum component FlaC
MNQETTNDLEQLDQYYKQLVLFIDEVRSDYIKLLEEKNRIEYILGKTIVG